MSLLGVKGISVEFPKLVYISEVKSYILVLFTSAFSFIEVGKKYDPSFLVFA